MCRPTTESLFRMSADSLVFYVCIYFFIFLTYRPKSKSRKSQQLENKSLLLFFKPFFLTFTLEASRLLFCASRCPTKTLGLKRRMRMLFIYLSTWPIQSPETGLYSTLCTDIQRQKRTARSAPGRQWIIDKSWCGGCAAPLADYLTPTNTEV